MWPRDGLLPWICDNLLSNQADCILQASSKRLWEQWQRLKHPQNHKERGFNYKLQEGCVRMLVVLASKQQGLTGDKMQPKHL